MGNHAAGKAMGLAAEIALKERQPAESAFALLDRICKRYRGCDAEFEAEDPNKPGYAHPEYDAYTDPHPGAALGFLMVEAFAPNGLADLPRYEAMMRDDPNEEVACETWRKEVYEPFNHRYGFC